MDLGLTGRVAIITGAGAGIGLATTRYLVGEGVRVVGADLDTTAIQGLGGADQVLPVTLDFRLPDAAKEVVSVALKQFGEIDILFNNAAVATVRDGFLSVTDEGWEQTLSLNFMGYVRVTRALLPHMVKRGKGVLIHCGSEAGRMPHPLLPDYSVSKAAILMLSKFLAREFTPKGIRSNVVAPAHIRTWLWDKPGGFLDSLAAKYGSDREEAVKIFLKESRLPAGRLGRPRKSPPLSRSSRPTTPHSSAGRISASMAASCRPCDLFH